MEPISTMANSIRQDFKALFGFRWDALVEWILISWLSLWLWMSMFRNKDLKGTYGPLDGLRGFLEDLGFASHNWLDQTISWASDPEHVWFSRWLVAVAVVAAVTTVRSYRLTGLRIVALFSVALAVQMQQSFWPIFWTLFWAAIPTGLALLKGFRDDHSQSGVKDREPYFSVRSVLYDFCAKIVLLFVMPLIAPLIVVAILIYSFEKHPPYNPIEELNSRATSVLYPTMIMTTDESADAALEEAAKSAEMVSIQLAESKSYAAQRLANRYLDILKTLRKAKDPK